MTSVSESLDAVLVRVTSMRTSSPCALCSPPSSSIPSYYRRHPMDLPNVGRPIQLLLTVKKFFCRVDACPRKIFTERLPELIEPSSRLTIRLRTAVQEIGFARCGSLLVKLETHTIIDLLPERKVESVIAWLETHPEIEVVSRDRGGTYVDGATKGAPLATQVCARWHLCKNLGDAMEAFLIRTRVRIPDEPAKPPPEAGEMPLKPAEVVLPKLSYREELSQERLRKRQEICQQAKDLHAQGWSIHAIARHLGRERTTIRKYLKVEGEWQPTPRQPGQSKLDPYREYLLSRWEQGCQNGQRLLLEIREQG